MHLPTLSFHRLLPTVLIVFASGVSYAPAATVLYTGAAGDGQYTTALNWSTVTTIPNTSNGDTALINNGAAVTYTPGGDLIISNGGELEVTNGSFTQAVGNAYIQLGQMGSGSSTGNGTILIDGGTFNQGTASSGPFNVTGTGNTFNMTSGAANFNRGFNLLTGLTSTLSGGTLSVTGGQTQVATSLTLSGANAALGTAVSIAASGTVSISAGTISTTGSFVVNGAFSMSGGTLTTSTASGEFDFNTAQNTLSGGTINTTLITGVNGSGTKTFNISGGALTLSSSNGNGIYGGGATAYINFTPNSTGQIDFLASTNATIATVQAAISRNAIEYNSTAYSSSTGFSNFSITQDSSNDIILSLASMTAVPEPATVMAGLLLTVCAAPMMVRRLRCLPV